MAIVPGIDGAGDQGRFHGRCRRPRIGVFEAVHGDSLEIPTFVAGDEGDAEPAEDVIDD